MELGTLGRYQLLKKIAVGGMGALYLARQKGPVGFQKLVVVKRLLPHLSEEQDFINMFFDEARIAALLNHPNIAQIYDLGEAPEGLYIAMEYVHGENLRQVAQQALDVKGGMPLALQCRVVADAAGALDFAHRAKTPSGEPLALIHRDVSPQNIIVGFSGSVKLIDFGVAKAAGKITRTATGIIKGKYAYMSPEQARGEDLDSRSDIFGLGIVFYEVLTSQRLFKKGNDTATLKAVVGLKVAPPSQVVKGIPKAIDAIVMKALERDRDDRFQTAGEFQLAIEEFLVRQRLPATQAHLAAFMKDLFPDEAAEDFVALEQTMSQSVGSQSVTTDSGPQSSEIHRANQREGRRATPAPASAARRPTGSQAAARAARRSASAPGLDAGELQLRISGCLPTDQMRGLFFAAVDSTVLRQLGPMGEPALNSALESPRAWVDALAYPTPEFLRLLWKAVELLATRTGSVEDTFSMLGAACMEALVRSPLGQPLGQLEGDGAEWLKGLFNTLQPMIAPGQRLVTEPTPTSALVVFKDEVLPVQFYTGLLSAAFDQLRGTQISLSWDKTAAARVEMAISW